MKKASIVVTIALFGAALWLLLGNSYNQNTLTSIEIEDSNPSSDSEINSQPQELALNTQGEKSSIVTSKTPLSHDQMEFAHSLRGTDIDGALSSDLHGNLVLNQQVRDFFDYFLSASDELGAEAAIGELQRYITDYLPTKAAGDARNLLANYLRYKQFESQTQQQPLLGENLQNEQLLDLIRNNFLELKLKRDELFSDGENSALFGLEDAYQEYTLSSLEILADDTLSEDQRNVKMTELQDSLPAELQQSQTQSNVQVEQQKDIDQLALVHQDDSAYHQALVDKGLSQPKANELVGYRQNQRQFNTTYQQYQTASAGLDPNSKDYQIKLDNLKAQYFIEPSDRTKAGLRDLLIEQDN